jgi:hypothetical protein
MRYIGPDYSESEGIVLPGLTEALQPKRMTDAQIAQLLAYFPHLLPFFGEGLNIPPALVSGKFVNYRKVADGSVISELAALNGLIFPAIYSTPDGLVCFATSDSAFTYLSSSNQPNLQIQQYPFEINENVTEITVSGFNMVYDDPNILVFLGGTLRNSGIEKDYRILSGNRVKFQWTPTESISGVVIKITL